MDKGKRYQSLLFCPSLSSPGDTTTTWWWDLTSVITQYYIYNHRSNRWHIDNFTSRYFKMKPWSLIRLSIHPLQYLGISLCLIRTLLFLSDPNIGDVIIVKPTYDMSNKAQTNPLCSNWQGRVLVQWRSNMKRMKFMFGSAGVRLFLGRFGSPKIFPK